MRVLISAEGHHEPAGHHLMAVDNHQFLIDLSGVPGALVDTGIVRVEWGPTVAAGEIRDGGTITRKDGSKQAFWDAAALEPYLVAWRARRDLLLVEHLATLEAQRQTASSATDDPAMTEAFGPKTG